MWQSSPNFLAPGTGFFEAKFSRDGGGRGFGMIQVHCITCVYLLCTLFLSLSHQLHLSSSGIRSQRLGIPGEDSSNGGIIELGWVFPFLILYGGQAIIRNQDRKLDRAWCKTQTPDNRWRSKVRSQTGGL